MSAMPTYRVVANFVRAGKFRTAVRARRVRVRGRLAANRRSAPQLARTECACDRDLSSDGLLSCRPCSGPRLSNPGLQPAPSAYAGVRAASEAADNAITI